MYRFTCPPDGRQQKLVHPHCPYKLYFSLLFWQNCRRLHAAYVTATKEAYLSSHVFTLNGLKVYIDELI